MTELGQTVKKTSFNESHPDLFLALNKGISSDHQSKKGVERSPSTLPNNCTDISYPKQFINPDISSEIKLNSSNDHSSLITESSSQIFKRGNAEQRNHGNKLMISDECPTTKNQSNANAWDASLGGRNNLNRVVSCSRGL